MKKKSAAKVKQFVAHIYPKFKKEQKHHLKAIEDYVKDPIKRMRHEFIYKYVPNDAVMLGLILKASKLHWNLKIIIIDLDF